MGWSVMTASKAYASLAIRSDAGIIYFEVWPDVYNILSLKLLKLDCSITGNQ